VGVPIIIQLGGWRTAEIHAAILTPYGLAAQRHRIPQSRSDLRKLKAHGLRRRDGPRYAYRLTRKGLKATPLFILFHEQLCGPLATASSTTDPTPAPPAPRANSKRPFTKLTPQCVFSGARKPVSMSLSCHAEWRQERVQSTNKRF